MHVITPVYRLGHNKNKLMFNLETILHDRKAERANETWKNNCNKITILT